MKTIIFILTLLSNTMYCQSRQDSVKLKTGARSTKATYTDKDRTHYKTVYLNQSDGRLFVITYNKKRKKYERKLLPKDIEID